VQGLPALSINWGPWKEFGGAARLNEAARSRQEQSGIGSIPTEEGRALFDSLWRRAMARVVAVPIDWERFRLRVGGLAFYKEFQMGEPNLSARYAPEIAGFTGASLNTKLEALLISELRVMLGQNELWLPDEEQGFFGMGMDSLTSLELRNRLEKTLGVKLNATAMFDFPTPRRLVEHLSEQLDAATAKPGKAVPNHREEELKDLNTAELAELLSEKLSSMDALG
jgi:acyl carrier protein